MANISLPPDFQQYTRSLLGTERYERLAKALDADEAPVSLRLNPFKTKGMDVDDALLDNPVAWCEATGHYLKSRPNFTFDPLLHAGAYYVQEASSMFVDHVVRSLINAPVLMLDLCAAPGGKSTALRAALPDGSLLFSNEPIRTRAQILSENIQKFGHEDVIVTNNYPRDYRKAGIMFDAILADVPCSGEGMFRKDEGARTEWSLQNVAACQKLQREIIEDIWHCLKPGGLLVYSTCTFNAHEDEENVEWIATELGADFISLPTEPNWHISPAVTGDNPVYRFLPGTSRGEGIFLAILRKHGGNGDDLGSCLRSLCGAANQPAKRRRKTGKAVNGKERNGGKEALSMLQTPDDFVLREKGDTLLALPKRWADVYDTVCDKLKILHAGVCLGTRKGKDLIPDQSLALSRCLLREAFPMVDVNYNEAINFLRKDAVVLPATTPRGFTLLSFRGMSLGFEKNIGNRANNLYPQEWRIKSSHVPETEVRVIGEK